MDERSDENLVLACQRGEKTQYAFLIKRHYKHVFAICLGLLGNVPDAEDIAQDAMLKGFLKIKKLRNRRQFCPWVSQIAKNLCFDLLRRQRHVKTILSTRAMAAGRISGTNHALQQCLGQLPKELRLILIMYYFENKQTKTIAEKLNISHSGVCKRLALARKELHKLLVSEV